MSLSNSHEPADPANCLLIGIWNLFPFRSGVLLFGLFVLNVFRKARLHSKLIKVFGGVAY